MVWRARGGPNEREIHQARIKKATDLGLVRERGDPTDGKASLRPHECRICTPERLARESGCFVLTNLIAASCNEEKRLASRLPLKDDRLGDLIHFNAELCGGLQRGFGLTRFSDFCRFTFKSSTHALETF